MANTQTFTGDGATTAFNFTFPFFGVNDIHTSINNVEVTSSNFTIAPNATPDDADVQYTGGTITFTTAPANGTTIKVWRHVELTRHIDYQPTLQPQSYQLNQDLNQCMEILKEQNETLTNVISLANIPTVSDLLTELSEIRNRLDDFLTADDLTTINAAIATLPSKANTDIDNLSDSGKESIVRMGIPNYSAGTTISAPTQANPYIASYPCMVAFDAVSNNGNDYVYINGTAFPIQGSTALTTFPWTLFLDKNDSIYCSAGQQNTWIVFPLKGIQNA